jgi:hypothetical protein
MKKNDIVSILLLLSLFTTLLLPLSVRTTEASNASLSYAPNYAIIGLDVEGEAENSTLVVNYIKELFDNYTYYGWNGNWSGNIVTPALYKYNAGFAELYFDNIALFSKGHASMSECAGGFNQSYIMTQTTHLYDWDYGSSAGSQAHELVVLWHCGTAMNYAPYTNMYCQSCQGDVSFPMAFTKDNTISLDGYNSTTGNRVFIGFEGWSPQFLSTEGLSTNCSYYHYCAVLYQFLVEERCTVKEALDATTDYVCDQKNFGESYIANPHYKNPFPENPEFNMSSRMRIYGNGNFGIP